MCVPENRFGLLILIVEDNLDCADSTALLLRLYGHEVEIVHDGLAAIDVLQARQYDVVLLDIVLPRLDGWQVAQRIPDGALGQRPFVIAVTGFGREEDKRRSAECGIDLHLTKPINPEELEACLCRLHQVIKF